MPSGKDFTSGKRTVPGKKNANCSFCRKSYRDVGPLVEGPEDVYICGECIDLCQSILDQERRRRGTPKKLFTHVPSPRQIVRIVVAQCSFATRISFSSRVELAA